MHEWALADAIVRTALNVAQENEADKVLGIRVVITFEEALFKCRNCSLSGN